jgi:hypothetical protein
MQEKAAIRSSFLILFFHLKITSIARGIPTTIPMAFVKNTSDGISKYVTAMSPMIVATIGPRKNNVEAALR